MRGQGGHLPHGLAGGAAEERVPVLRVVPVVVPPTSGCRRLLAAAAAASSIARLRRSLRLQVLEDPT